MLSYALYNLKSYSIKKNDVNDDRKQSDKMESHSKGSDSRKIDNSSADSQTLEDDSRPYLRRPWFGSRSDKEPGERGTKDSKAILDESTGDRTPSLSLHQNQSVFDQSKSGPRRLQLEPKAPEDNKKSDKNQEVNNSNATVITENENDGNETR